MRPHAIEPREDLRGARQFIHRVDAAEAVAEEGRERQVFLAHETALRQRAPAASRSRIAHRLDAVVIWIALRILPESTWL